MSTKANFRVRKMTRHERGSGALEYRQPSAAELYRKEAERARENANQAAGARNRAFWLALAANWEKLAEEAKARE